MARMRETGRRHGPDRLPRLQEAFREQVRLERVRHPPRTLILAGKSMGGRVASLLVDELAATAGVGACVCFGYPFHPPGKPQQLRTNHLVGLSTPCLIVQGEKDPFGKREDQSAPLKIGQFVEAEIVGVPLADVFVLPRSAVRAGNEIILITRENRLRRLTITPLAGDAKHIVISALDDKGPTEGDVLCVTPIPFPVDGARVLPTIDGQTERPGMAGTEGAERSPSKGKRPANECSCDGCFIAPIDSGYAMDKSGTVAQSHC
jgi:hypothetical protein